MICNPTLSVRPSGGVSAYAHLTLHRRLSVSPEDSLNFRLISIPVLNFAAVFAGAVIICIPVSEIFSINSAFFVLPEIRSALKLTVVLLDPLLSDRKSVV